MLQHQEHKTRKIFENIINVSAISTLSVENQQIPINFPFFGKEYHSGQNEKLETTESYLSSWLTDCSHHSLTCTSDAITVLSATFCASLFSVDRLPG